MIDNMIWWSDVLCFNHWTSAIRSHITLDRGSVMILLLKHTGMKLWLRLESLKEEYSLRNNHIVHPNNIFLTKSLGPILSFEGIGMHNRECHKDRYGLWRSAMTTMWSSQGKLSDQRRSNEANTRCLVIHVGEALGVKSVNVILSH